MIPDIKVLLFLWSNSITANRKEELVRYGEATRCCEGRRVDSTATVARACRCATSQPWFFTLIGTHTHTATANNSTF
jgi:hypothetical protein